MNVEDLSDGVCATPESVPMHTWQKDELAKRKANLTAHPESGTEWAEVKHRIRSRYSR